MKIAVAQINPIVADVQGNYEKIRNVIKKSVEETADLVVFPEMAVLGYPPMDLLENKKLIDDNLESIDKISKLSDRIAIICGFVDYDYSDTPMLFNSAAFMVGGKIVSSHRKTLLPSYDVFDEVRYFNPAPSQNPVSFRGSCIGITICEDIWNDYEFENNYFMGSRRYTLDPVDILLEMGAAFMINISASPYAKGKNSIKWEMISNIAKRNSVPILYVNQVGGNDSLIFDGNSFMMDSNGEFIARAKSFEEDLVVIDTENAKPIVIPEIDEVDEIRQALVLGIRDYVEKCGFTKVVIGLSGGIDSALTATLAVQALGAGNVMGVTMPSVYSSKGSVTDSVKLARNLGIRIEEISIKELFLQYKMSLKDIFKDRPEDVAEENVQARIRGNLLMAISNKFGSLLLTTGNKSELAMGYCTLYGDMSGGLAVLSDLPKSMVYQMARHINREGEIIPAETIEKPPSAELRENQRDEDSLPPYDLLDQILERYIEKRMSAEEIVREGFPEDAVRFVLGTVDRNEYKRRQAPPGLKVTSKAFGIGRRIPIAQKFIP
jgi:NAD+ synthase (glutamine-hydrolysing)